jgi:hypothetical protein
MINQKNKRVDLPVKEFVAQFPIEAKFHIDSFFSSNESIPYAVPTVLDYLLDAFEGYEEEKELKSLMRKWEKYSSSPSYVEEELYYRECTKCEDSHPHKVNDEYNECTCCGSINKYNEDED